MATYDLSITGMHCNSCKILVTDALEELGATKVRIDLDEKKQIGKATFEYAGTRQAAVKAIEKEGYKAA